MSDAEASQSSGNFAAWTAVPLRPVLRSLGLPPSAFRNPGSAMARPLFDACVNASVTDLDRLLVFRDAEYWHYNLATKAFEGGPRPISSIAQSSGTPLPPVIAGRVTAAADGGNGFPDIHYLFHNETYLALRSSAGRDETAWSGFEGPRGVLGVWALGVWTHPDGTFLTDTPLVGLRGEDPAFTGMIHFFKDGAYLRHDLHTGRIADGPRPIKDLWRLPEAFLSRIDAAFYGGVAAPGHIYFLSAASFVLYDPQQRQVLRSGFIAEEFPAFRPFLKQPQLFIEERYELRPWGGRHENGTLVASEQVAPGASVDRVFVFELANPATRIPSDTVLREQGSPVLGDFERRLLAATRPADGTSAATYGLGLIDDQGQTSRATWGGEVYAATGVQGSGPLRADLAAAVFDAVAGQITDARHLIRIVPAEALPAALDTSRVLARQTVTLKNGTDHVAVRTVYEDVQNVVAMLVLTGAAVAYDDGTGTARSVDLADLPGLLAECLAPSQPADPLIRYIETDLSTIDDANGMSRSILAAADAASGLAASPALYSTLPLLMPDGTQQSITTSGLMTAIRSVRLSTRQVRVDPEAAAT